MRIRKTEIMQIAAAALMKIVGEYGRCLATHSRAGRGLFADLEDGWPQTRVRELIVREVVSGPAEPQRIQVQGMVHRGCARNTMNNSTFKAGTKSRLRLSIARLRVQENIFTNPIAAMM